MHSIRLIVAIGWLTLVLAWGPAALPAQQAADPDFNPTIKHPSFEAGTGPVIAIDEAHHNFHTRQGRYAPFARLLEADGYRVRSHVESFDADSLRGIDVLVIANALHQNNVRRWELPTPAAFTDTELAAIVDFVQSGGGLLLIADHMPFPGACQALASRLGIEFANGFHAQAGSDGELAMGKLVFDREGGGIAEHPITEASPGHEKINQVMTFTGSAFRFHSDALAAKPLLKLPKASWSINPHKAWKFTPQTPRQDVSGWLQGGTVERAKGRVAVFAEAAMFTAQRSASGQKTGMHCEGARDNQQLALRTMRWLSTATEAADD